MSKNDNESIPPHQRPNMPRLCWPGVFTLEEAQAKLSASYPGAVALEVRPAQCLSEGREYGELIAATEVIFE